MLLNPSPRDKLTKETKRVGGLGGESWETRWEIGGYGCVGVWVCECGYVDHGVNVWVCECVGVWVCECVGV